MNDTLTPKALSLATLDTGNFPGSALSFPRVASAIPNEHVRESVHVDSLSPTAIRIAHKPRPKNGSGSQYSLFATEQVLARYDTEGNAISFSRFALKLTAELPQDVTEAEQLALAEVLLGALLEGNGAGLKAFLRRET